MLFIVDAMLPPSLVNLLAEHGHEAQHLSQLDLLGAKDSVIWERAVGLGAAILTKDDDFSKRRATTSTGPQIVWLRVGNVRRSRLLSLFESGLPAIVAALERGDSVVEVTD